MLRQLFFSACILLAIASLDGKILHKQYKVARESTPCDSDRVQCPTSERCIPQRWFCDGDNDCGDDSDEENCPPVTCSEGQTKCPTKNRCKPTIFFCDGQNDCGDNSDEPEECRSRTCPEGQLKCNSGQCIDKMDYCTRAASCRDNTEFTDAGCPHIACDGGYVKCTHKTKCIKSSYVCDGDNDCGDNSDEPGNCRERLCEAGEFKCNNGQCINRTALCLSIDSYGCKDATDTSDLCSTVTCPTGYTKCVSDGKCTANSNLCDGSSDCADGSDELPQHCTAPMQCSQSDQAPCPTVRRCINTRYFCDTDNDCGNNSDEEASFCSARTCEPTEIRCQNGQCLDKDGFCRGSYSCRDGSYSDKSDICTNQIHHSQIPSAAMPSAEELACFTGLMQARQTCGESPFPELTAGPSSERALYQKLVEMDLRELCSITQTWFQCYQSAFSPCTNVNNPMLADAKQMMSIGELALNYVCVQEVEVFNRNKACLLRKADTHSPDPTRELVLGQALEQACSAAADRMQQSPGTNPLCISQEIHGCFKDVVATQCGDEVAGALSGLADQIMAAAGCQAPQARSFPYSQKKHRAVRQLASGDEEESQCMMAIVFLEETCGENPLQSFAIADARTFYNRLVTDDLRELCGLVQPWFECVTNVFSTCANVDNPMIAGPKRMLALAGSALNFVCVQNVDVINRNKACLLRESSDASRGPYPQPVIAGAVQASCSHLFQPGQGDPMCMPDAPLQACAKNVVTAQCGTEIANTLDGFINSIHAQAGCPARSARRSLLAALKKRRGLPYHKRP